MTTVHVEESTGLHRETNWWGAFVIGLAGTLLVTGVTVPVLTGLGAAAIPAFIFVTLTGYLLCIFLAELAAMFPERTGGAPAYALAAFSYKWPRFAKHVNGVTAWMYWLGWNPVIAVSMLLTGTYLYSLFNLNTGNVPIQMGATPVPWGVFILGVVVSIVLYIPCYFGIKFGALSATLLGVLSMIPLTFIALAPYVFKANALHWGDLFPLNTAGMPFFSWGSWWLLTAFFGLLTWNVIAMEAAACYIGECSDPGRDAPIAMNAEGIYGLFIYTMVPLAFLLVLGLKGVTAGSYGVFATFGAAVLGSWANYPLVALLIVALALSTLNAIMGCARSLHQMTLDGQFPRIFAHLNSHSVPDFSMGLNVVLNWGLLLLGAPAAIYVFSNVGYVGSFVPVLIGYYLLRQQQPNLPRPYRLPEWMKYLALLVAAFYLYTWAVGIPLCSANPGCDAAGSPMPAVLGLLVVLLYFPLNWYRTRIEDKRHAAREAKVAPSA